jgi:hypothetical protein
MTASTGPRPCISVIIPVYNVAEHVAACIDSLRTQTMTDFEALVIDDGATDGSGDIALEAARGDPRFTLIRQDNAGLSGARNTGLEAATGSYIAFIDSDDRVMPDYLMRLWQTLEDTGGDWVACAVQSCHVDGTGSTHSAIHGAADLAGHSVARRYTFDSWTDVIRHFPSAWNKLYRRSLIEGLRFDAGTWFEDHGFFHRAAARTDHIIHLPDALYLQTRGRAGQITAQDSERVFEQFNVLETLGQIFESSPRPGAETALARIASRLTFERSTTLSDPDRRARFAAATRDFLAQHSLKYSTDWDSDIALSWGTELGGTLPLSVVLSWDGADIAALRHSLDALRDQSAPGHEVLIVCQSRAAQRALAASGIAMPAHWQILTAPRQGTGAGFNHGLAQASGVYVVFVETGDALTPWTLLDRVEAMMHAEADFGIAQMRLVERGTGVVSYHNGMHAMTLWPAGTPPAGPLPLTPAQALDLEAHCSAKIFRSGFLHDTSARFTTGPRPDWALCLISALAGRSTYITSAGATVALQAQGLSRWHTPQTGRALNQGHNALLETIKACTPPDVRAKLPAGWERKLFARALREQVYFGKYSGRLPRLSMLAGAAWGALRHGYGTPQQAGVDPFVGPRLARLLDPVRTIAVKLRLARGRADIAVATDPDAPDATADTTPKDLHSFDLHGHGMLRMRARFHTAPYANIHFRAQAQGPAVFHLSLRHAEGLAVCNHQRPGGQWHREQIRSVAFGTGGADIAIVFTPPRVTVLLDGAEIFHFHTKGRRRGAIFPDLETIAGFTVEGDITADHIIPRMPDAPLILDSRLMLRMPAFAPDMQLRVLADDLPLPVIEAPQGTASALLPARLWRDLAPDAALTLELAHAGQSHHLTLTRADVAARIEALLALPLAQTDSTLCLTLLEHAGHGGLHSLLGAPARVRLDALASFYGVQDFLEHSPGQDTAPDAQVALPAEDPIGREVETAIARIAQSQTAPPGQRPDLLDVMAQTRVSHRATPLFFLSLSEYFCTGARDFTDLYRLAQSRNVLPFDTLQTRWGLSATLPFLLAEAQYERVIDALKTLAPPRQEWLVMAAIAWTAREAVSRPETPAEHRRAIFYAFTDLVYKRAGIYWERVHCREMTRTAASLIRHRDQLEPQQQADAVVFGMRVYGLSRQFWADLDGMEDLPEALVYARQAFEDVMATETPAPRRDRALRVFEGAKNPDAPRLRRELFGPAGLADPERAVIAAQDLFDTYGPDHPALGETALRHMASPGALPVAPSVAQMAQTALPTLYPKTPRAPYFDLQQSSCRQAMALLDSPEAAAGMVPLTEGLAQLAGAGSRYLGLAMALALIDGLQHSAPARAHELGSWLRHQTAGQDPAAYGAAPAVRQAVRRLCAAPDLPSRTADLLEALNLYAEPIEAPDNAGLPAGSPLFDTIVTVFSCAPYLDTRIPAMRAGWLGLLQNLGVPYVVVVGDGDGRREGDIVHLDAPDDYEGLPQKTLATIAWVHDNTRFGHMLKIDDDCFLNAPLFFESLGYRKHDYYGRRLYRAAGQMDRQWHQEKSSSARGRLDLDKSPEPSEYADGGTAYALSRTAMAAALEAARSPEGRQLIAVSFMEDKMLGDLLALQGIRLSEEDYRISLRRRTFGAATPVAMFHNSFHPSQTAQVQLVHLDTHLDQADALARLGAPGLWPRKIWPGYQPVKLGYQSNALELISSESSVERARGADVAVVACMRNEMFMLPHFLAHYRKLGVEAFLIADNCSDDGTREYLVEQPDVALFSVDTDYKLSHYGVAWQQAMMAAFRVGKWSLVADADELLVWQQEQTQTLADLLKTPDFATVDAARLFMLDMYPQGPLEGADFATATPFAQAGFADRIPFLTKTLSRGPYADQPSWTSALRHRLIPGSQQRMFVAQKLALLRYLPTMRLSAGLHFVGDVDISARELVFAHFKYNADFRRKAQAEVARGQHFNGAEEYRKYLALTSEARSVIYDPDLSMPWCEVPFVKHRLDV